MWFVLIELKNKNPQIMKAKIRKKIENFNFSNVLWRRVVILVCVGFGSSPMFSLLFLI
jgi:hypothetical protein